MDLFKNIKNVFVDLDDTIWDFTANSILAMKEVYANYGLDKQCPYERFIKVYLRQNDSLWALYHHGKISKEYLRTERFRASFKECGIVVGDSAVPERIDCDYLNAIVRQTQVVAGAHELLACLKQRGPVYVLSNGFSNLQHLKLQSGGLDKYIDRLFLSDDINVTKPDKRLFDYALSQLGGKPESTILIGDNYDADILGAYNAGWHTVFLNRKGLRPNPNVADLTVASLAEIIPYLRKD